MTTENETVVWAKVIGPFQLEDARGNSLLPRAQKSLGLLAYLCLQGHRKIARSVLIDLFWSDRQKEQGQASLRQSLSDIRSALGELSWILKTDRHTISILKAAIALDLWQADKEICTDISRTILEGLDPIAPVFDEWLDEERRWVHSNQLKTSEERLITSAGRPDAELDAATRVLLFDTQHEEAARTAMRVHALNGAVSKANMVFENLSKALAEDGFTVDEQTSELMQSIRSERSRSVNSVHSTPQVRTTPPTLVIVPIGTRDNDTITTISANLTEDLTSRITAIRELRVLSQAHGAMLDAAGAEVLNEAKRLGVDYFVTGTIRSKGNTLEGTFSLLQVSNGQQIWSKRLPVEATDGYDHFSEFVEFLVSAILPVIERCEYISLKNAPETLSAYAHYIKAKQLIVSASEPSYMARAETHLFAALEQDPTFTPPYSHLIGSLNTGRKHTSPGLDFSERRKEALRLAKKMLVLDATNPHAHHAMAWCLFRIRQFDLARISLDEAVRLEPYEPLVLNAIGTCYVYLGEYELGRTYYDTARNRLTHDLDYMRTDYGELHFLHQDYEQALDLLSVGEIRNPLRPMFLRCAALGQLGRTKEAHEDGLLLNKTMREAWCGTGDYSSKLAIEWMLENFNFRNSKDNFNLASGLRGAGFEF